MRQMIKIVRAEDLIKERKEMLKEELDYELATLFDAMQKGDEEQKAKSKQRLTEIHTELGL